MFSNTVKKTFMVLLPMMKPEKLLKKKLHCQINNTTLGII